MTEDDESASPNPAEMETVAETGAGPSPRSSATGRRIGPFRILHPLGEGGMGAVFLAEQIEPIRRTVALKVIRTHTGSADVLARFDAERQALAILDHPGVAKVLDAGSDDDGSPYFVMEYVAGAPITTFCDLRRLSIRERLRLFASVCLAVQHAHQKGIIHRDLKPSNILVTEIDGRPVPKVIDFGIAKATTAPLTGSAFRTHLGTLIGTPAYMSPEQAALNDDVDTRADVYSLGVLLYELLTGVLPFEPTGASRSFDALRRRILEEEPAKPSLRLATLAGARADDGADRRGVDRRTLHRQLRGDLDWIVLRALEKDRERRYQTANALALDIERHLRNEPVAAAAPSAAYRVGKFMRRHRIGVAAAGFILAAIVTGLAVATLGFVRATHERDRAVAAEAEARATTRFLTNMLASADPERTQGREVTVREALDEASATVGTAFANEPRTEATVRATIGSVYDSMGLFSEAASHTLRALELRESLLGGAHRDVAVVVNQLAVIRFHEGRLDEAEALWKRGLAILADTAGTEDPAYLVALHNLGAVYLGRSRLDEAERLLVAALEGRRRILGDDHVQTLTTMSNLAQCYDLQGRPERAEPMLRHVLEVRRRDLGDRHPRTIVATYNLADSLVQRGRFAEAVPFADRALAGFQEVLGADHPNTKEAEALVARLRQTRPGAR